MPFSHGSSHGSTNLHAIGHVHLKPTSAPFHELEDSHMIFFHTGALNDFSLVLRHDSMAVLLAHLEQDLFRTFKTFVGDTHKHGISQIIFEVAAAVIL